MELKGLIYIYHISIFYLYALDILDVLAIVSGPWAPHGALDLPKLIRLQLPSELRGIDAGCHEVQVLLTIHLSSI